MQKYPILSQASDTVAEVDGKPVLVVYPISKDLHTSMEVESLKVQTIMKYANIDFVLKEHHESNFSPSQHLPCLIIGEIVLAGREILRYISTKMDLDASFNKSERASAFAHAAMAQAKLGTALEACLWYETTQFNEITAKSRGVYYPWPLNYLIPRQERARVIDEILSRKPVIQMQDIYLAAAGALDALSLLLGEQLYFFGSRPTTLDATVFALIHSIMTALSQTSPESKLRKLVQNHKNLVEHAKRTWTTWFAPNEIVAVSPRA